MRIRTIKPEWLSSQKLASASDAARLLSVALIVMADDHGRGRGSIAEIAMQVWRYEMTRDNGAKVRETLAKVRETLAELSATGFVRLYQVDGNDYFELPAWAEHQRVDKPGKAKIPGPYDASENFRESLAKVPRSLATDQGSGIRDQGPRSVCVDDPNEAEQPAAPEARTGESARAHTPGGTTYVTGQQTLADTFRAAVEQRYRAANLPAPKVCRDPYDAVWAELARWLHEAHKLRGWSHSKPDMAREMVRAFYASTDPRTVAAKHNIKYLAARPEEYLGLKVPT